MSFLFGGGGRGHSDPELAEANRRQREHFARDINDQRTLAASGMVTLNRRRAPWLLLAAVATFFLLAAFVKGGADPFAIERSCTEPGLQIEARVAGAGETFRVRTTGPQDDQYILTIDGEPVQGQPDRQVAFTSTPDGPAYALTDCVSPAFLVQAPVQPGEHDIGLLQSGAAGTTQVASVELTVVE